jgi:hypothetical protein
LSEQTPSAFLEDFEDRAKRTRKGKVCELLVISKLLDKGLEVYTPTIDTGIDCIVKSKTNHSYFELQIKGTKYNVSIRGGRKVQAHAKNSNYFLVFVSDRKHTTHHAKDIFFLDSNDIQKQIEKCNINKKEDETVHLHIGLDDRKKFLQENSFNKLVKRMAEPVQNIEFNIQT